MFGEEEKNGARSAVILAILVVVIAAYVGAFGLQTLVWIETHHWTAESPWLLDVPQAGSAPTATRLIPLILLRCRHPRRRKKHVRPEMLRAYIYEFASPWTSKSKVVPSDNHVDFRFDSGQDIVFFDPEAQLDTLRALKTTDTIEYSRMRDVFSEPFFESNYDLYNSVYSASPAQTSPFMNGTEAMRKNVLLLWKLASDSIGREFTPSPSEIIAASSSAILPAALPWLCVFSTPKTSNSASSSLRSRFVRRIHARRHQRGRPDPPAGASSRTLKRMPATGRTGC